MVTFGVRHTLVVTLILSWSLVPSARASETRATFRRIRVLPPCLASLIEHATAASPTIRPLAARIEQSDLIVYVRCVAFRIGGLAGRLQFMGENGGQRFLLIELRTPEQWETQVPTLAHELQHAVEIADATWVRGQAAMIAYYRQAGVTLAVRPFVFDTEAARSVGLRVQRELARWQHAAPAERQSAAAGR